MLGFLVQGAGNNRNVRIPRSRRWKQQKCSDSSFKALETTEMFGFLVQGAGNNINVRIPRSRRRRVQQKCSDSSFKALETTEMLGFLVQGAGNNRNVRIPRSRRWKQQKCSDSSFKALETTEMFGFLVQGAGNNRNVRIPRSRRRRVQHRPAPRCCNLCRLSQGAHVPIAVTAGALYPVYQAFFFFLPSLTSPHKAFVQLHTFLR